MEWTGWIPFASLPHTFDPPQHFIVTANNRPMPPDYPYLIGLEYPEPYRAQRITDLLRQRGGLTADDMRQFQSDTYSLHAQTLLPLLLRTVETTDPDDQLALDLLRAWNYDAAGDSIAPALYEAWFLKLVPVIAGDDLGARVLERYEGRYSYVTRFLTATLTRQRRHVVRRCDDAGDGDVPTVGDQGPARGRRRSARRARRRHEGMAVERRASSRLSASGSGRRGDAAAAARPVGAGTAETGAR